MFDHHRPHYRIWRARTFIIGLLSLYSAFSLISGSAAAQTSLQTFGETAGSHTSQTGSATFIPAPTAGTTWARAGAIAPSSPIALALGPNPLGSTGAYLRGTASSSTSVAKFSPWVGYPSGTEFYTSFRILLGDASGGNNAASGSWSFFQGSGPMYSDATDFTGAQVFTGLRFTFNSAGAIGLSYRGASSFINTGLSVTTLDGGTVYTIEILGNNNAGTTVDYSYHGSQESVAVQRFDLYLNGVLIGDDLPKALLPPNTGINAGTFTGINSIGNVANVFVDDVVVYNSIPASIGRSIFTSVETLPDFGPVEIGSVSTPQGYIVSGTDLDGNIVITAPPGFEIKRAADVVFGPTVTLSPILGALAETVIAVRFRPATTGPVDGGLTHVTPGAVTRTVSVSGSGIIASPGAIRLGSAAFSANEGSRAAITVTRDAGSLGAVSVNYATSGGTATSGASCGASTDYLNAAGLLTWDGGDTSDRIISIEMCTDADANEGPETLVLQLADVTGGASIGEPSSAVITIEDVGQAFCSSGGVALTEPGTAPNVSAPYPSAIEVTGLVGSIDSLKITLNHIVHSYSSDVDLLLVGPTGQKFVLMSDVGGDSGFSLPRTVSITDQGAAHFTDENEPIASGIYKPTNYEPGDVFPAPAPGGPYQDPMPAGHATLNNTFGGSDPNGTWRIYAVDDEFGDSGSIAGWCIELETAAAPGDLRFSSPNYVISEAGSNAIIAVDRIGGYNGAVSVDYATSDVTASGSSTCSTGADYVGTAGTLSFADMQTTQTIQIPICPDNDPEPTEIVHITLSNPTGGAAVVGGNPATLFIADTSPFSGTYYVGAGEVFSSLTNTDGLFDAINERGLDSDTQIIITTDLTAETGAIMLQQWVEQGIGGYTLTLRPAGHRTVSGNVAGALITLNGADRVTLDGLNTAESSLTIFNSAASSAFDTSTIRLMNGASDNTITNSTLLGSATSSAANGATVLLSGDAQTSNGNDNNTISSNKLGPAGANLPAAAILGAGATATAAAGNSGTVIRNNDIYDYFGNAAPSFGIATRGGCSYWEISDNRFYQSGLRTWTTASVHRAIDIGPAGAPGGAEGFNIVGNIVGYSAPDQTGTYALTGSGSNGKFAGIAFNGVAGGAETIVNNNTVSNISMTGVAASGTGVNSPFAGIIFQQGVGETSGNIIGSQSAAGSMTFSTTTISATHVYGILYAGSSSWVSDRNLLGGISFTNLGGAGIYNIYGIRSAAVGVTTWQASSNQIGGTVADSIKLNATGSSPQVVGLSSAAANLVLISNTVRNLSSNTGTGTAAVASVIGINANAAADHIIARNSVSALGNTHPTIASHVTGIHLAGSTANVVEQNLIQALYVATNNAAGGVDGIRVGGGSTVYRNNIVSIGAGIPNAVPVIAINEQAGTNAFYHNSVLVSGTPISGTSSSYAFLSAVTANARSVENNIFQNSRSRAGSKNYAVQVGGSSPNPAGLAIDHNIYLANGLGGVFGRFNSLDVGNLSAWRTAVGQDAHSIEAGPEFVSEADLHLKHASPGRNAGAVGTVIVDVDGDARDGEPDIGADEVKSFQFEPAMYSVDESAGSVTVTVTRTAGSAGVGGVIFSTLDSSATGGIACGQGIDYIHTSGVIEFAVGEISKDVIVNICPDPDTEINEVIDLILTVPTGAVLGSTYSATLRIVDDDQFATPSATATASPSISGSVKYKNALTAGYAVPNTLISAAGSSNVSTTSDVNGNYSLSGFGAGAYTVTPSKTPMDDLSSNGITVDDAALIARHVVGLETLTDEQKEAARVLGDPTITTLDAAYIARWIVGFNDASNQTGTWKFTPGNRAYAQMIGTPTAQDFAGLLMGDVNRDWLTGPSARPSLLADPTWKTAIVSVPNVSTVHGSVLTIPVRIDNLAGRGISCYQFGVEYDPAVLSPIDAETAGTMSSTLSAVSNERLSGLFKVAAFGAYPAMGDGVWINLRFNVVGTAGTTSPVALQGFRFNDGSSGVVAQSGRVKVVS